MEVLKSSFYSRDTVIVAQELLGKIVVRLFNEEILAGIITETEAYGYMDDPASHNFKGKTRRNKAMFGPAGCAYVYVSYGLHHCFNIVAKSEAVSAGGVLIRSLHPLMGIDVMQQQRKCTTRLTHGPGNVAQALGITMHMNEKALIIDNGLYVIDEGIVLNYSATRRIGVTKGQDKLWRFVVSE